MYSNSCAFLCIVSCIVTVLVRVLCGRLSGDGEALLSFAISVVHCIFSCYRSQIQLSHSHLVLMVPCSTNRNISDNTSLLKYSYCACRKAVFTDLPPMHLSNWVLQPHIKSEITFNFPCWRTRIDFWACSQEPRLIRWGQDLRFTRKDRHHCNSTLGHSLWLQFVEWIQKKKERKKEKRKKKEIKNIETW